jgi:predicted lipoprotein with Yx(FWY)xxD motif
MKSLERTVNRPANRLWAAVALTGLAMLATLVLLSAGARAAAAPSRSTSAVVVKVAKRGGFGKILTTVGGPTLYKHPNGPCTGSCLAVWPPLLMPKGKTIPRGIVGLRTVLLANGRRQVSYRHRRLYTFVNDTGSSVNGNGVAGFLVAKVVS